MRLLIVMFVFFMSIVKTNDVFCQSPKDLIFVLDKSMFQDFDTLNFEIGLTDSARTALAGIDFSSYSYLWVPFSTTLIQIIPWTLQLRPSAIFIYRDNYNNIASDNGKIRIVVEHLDKVDERVLLLKKFLNSKR